MTIQATLSQARRQLKSANIKSAQLDAELLLLHVLDQPKEWLITHQDYLIGQEERLKYSVFIKRRLDREPVCYITNKIEFYGVELYVDNHVLAPRSETEIVVEQAIKNAPRGSRLIDIGTGSGAIAIAIAINRPDLTITATEVSPEALKVAQNNAESILGKNHKINFIKADIWENIQGTYEAVVTNLPYVSEDHKSHMQPEVAKEPAIAIFGGQGDGLDLYRRFYRDLPQHIAPGSYVYHESDPWQHEGLKKLAKQAELKLILEDYLVLGFIQEL